MDFLHKREYLNAGDIVVVDCSHQCNVTLTTDANFRKYQNGQAFEYYGGAYKRFPVRIEVPRTGNWNISLDLGHGRSARIKHSISFIKKS
jgi:hypothetical protein